MKNNNDKRASVYFRDSTQAGLSDMLRVAHSLEVAAARSQGEEPSDGVVVAFGSEPDADFTEALVFAPDERLQAKLSRCGGDVLARLTDCEYLDLEDVEPATQEPEVLSFPSR